VWPFGVAHVIIGCLLDPGALFGFLRAFDLATREAYLWGEGEERMHRAPYADRCRLHGGASARWPAHSGPPLHGRGLHGTRARRCHQATDGQEETVAERERVTGERRVDSLYRTFKGVR
jgi:hypothetical protein